ncbi:Rib/alpha-like domain-containing protein [Corynebacterium pilbarense]
MQRFALPAVVVVAASLLSPAASAAMADEYAPHFDPEARHVKGKPGDGYTFQTFYELEDVPEGATWKLTGRDTSRELMQLEKRGDKLGVRLNHNDANPPQSGENTQPIDIRVTFPDTSTDVYSPEITLIPDEAFLYEPMYKSAVGDGGQTITLEPFNRWELDLPADAKWDVTGGGSGWDWSHDEKTGVITAKVPTDSYADAGFSVVTTFADGSKRSSNAKIENSGKGVTLPEDPAPRPEASKPAPEPEAETGSSTAQKLGLIFGVLALLVGAAAFAWPQLQQFLPKM